MRRHAARAAAQVGDRPAAATADTAPDPAHALGEGGQHGPVQRLSGQIRDDQPCVVDGDGVVGRPYGAQVRGLCHAPEQ